MVPVNYTEDSLFKQLVWKLNSNLCATRDLLLPRLVSGEVDVSGLEVEQN
ncbi:MAG: hypothetical protein H8D34_20225 [Chloroflexi bacterium]|nr:hypothetical protein [Chloroflexota bacterium]